MRTSGLLLVAIGVASVGVACDLRPLMVGAGNDGGPPDLRQEGVAEDGRGEAGVETACSARFLTDPANPFSPTLLPQCLDGLDNDGDGLIDYADPDCTSFGDNDESSFAIRTGTDEEDFFCHPDCAFDTNPG